jgi:hypothetical protein
LDFLIFSLQSVKDLKTFKEKHKTITGANEADKKDGNELVDEDDGDDSELDEDFTQEYLGLTKKFFVKMEK